MERNYVLRNNTRIETKLDGFKFHVRLVVADETAAELTIDTGDLEKDHGLMVVVDEDDEEVEGDFPTTGGIEVSNVTGYFSLFAHGWRRGDIGFSEEKKTLS